MALFIGVDIGGTKVLAAAVSSTGRVLRTARRETPGRRVEARLVEDALTEAVQEIAGPRRPSAIGIAAAGFVDAQGERVRFAPHLPWRDEGVRARLAERWSAPVVLDNDANCAARAEVAYGAVGDAGDALVITLGTGIGGAVVLDGAVHRGYNGMAGEFGHMQVVPDGLPCECGGTGCWEQYCSGNALARARAADRGRRRRLTGPMVTEAAEAGRPGRAGGVRGGRRVARASGSRTWSRPSTRRSWSSAAGSRSPATCCSSRRGWRCAGRSWARRTARCRHWSARRSGPEAGAIGAAYLARQTFRNAGTRARARLQAARGTGPRR